MSGKFFRLELVNAIPWWHWRKRRRVNVWLREIEDMIAAEIDEESRRAAYDASHYLISHGYVSVFIPSPTQHPEKE